MGANGTNPERTRIKWPVWKKVYVGVVAVTLAAAITLTLLYWPGSPFRARTVSYEYTVALECDPSSQFAVICPLPANHDGMTYPDDLAKMIVVGDVTISRATTPYGYGLEVVGNGSAVIEWSLRYIYRLGSQSLYDHYSELSILQEGEEDLVMNAPVHLVGADISFSLNYGYVHVYGSVGADYLTYEVVGNLTAGWNTLPVDFDHAVS